MGEYTRFYPAIDREMIGTADNRAYLASCSQNSLHKFPYGEPQIVANSHQECEGVGGGVCGVAFKNKSKITQVMLTQS